MSTRELVPAASAATKARAVTRVSGMLLQRKCACGGSTEMGGECEECKKKKLQRKAIGNGPAIAPPIVHEVLRSPGQPLDQQTRSFFEPHFGHDFSKVRVHADSQAGESARAVRALAYTVGHDLVFGAGHFAPSTKSGQRLLAHELTHVVQQTSARQLALADDLTLDESTTPSELEARNVEAQLFSPGSTEIGCLIGKSGIHAQRRTVARADPAATQVTMNLGTPGRAPRTGLQFLPNDVTDTQVGPVNAQGGLASGGVSRLSVIVGENLTLRALARVLLPLWTTATPFTPTGAAAPLPLAAITEDDLAKGLLVYNQNFLLVPAMTNWRAGLRFPLPVDVDETTHMGTLQPSLILQLAASFDPAWLPLLDRRAAATAAPPAATTTADVTSFLAQEPAADRRGRELSIRIQTNALAAIPFVREAFHQLGAAGFDVALAFMDNMVNREVTTLAAQRDGAAALALIRTALTAAPAAPTAAQSQSLARSNVKLGLAMAILDSDPSGAAGSRAEKTVTIDTVKLDGSNHNPTTDVEIANGIFSQCNVRFAHGVNATATNADTTAWLGGNTNLRGSGVCGAVSTDERNLFRAATARFGLTGRIRAFFPATITGESGAAGYSYPPYCATGPASLLRDTAFLSNTSDTGDLAHEIGHILLNSGAHPAANLMNPTGPPQGERLTDTQCTTIYRNS